MAFDEEKGNSPAFVDEGRQKNKGLIDLAAMRKGLNYHGTEKN